MSSRALPLLALLPLAGCPPPFFCFIGSTRVLTPRGWRRIDTLAEGDVLWSWDLDAHAPVEGTLSVIRRSTADRVFTVVAGELRIDGVTATHPFYLPQRREWVTASQLRPGDEVLAWLGSDVSRSIPITEVSSAFTDVEVFDLTVPGQENFFAEGVLVHNKSPADDCPADCSNEPGSDPSPDLEGAWFAECQDAGEGVGFATSVFEFDGVRAGGTILGWPDDATCSGDYSIEIEWVDTSWTTNVLSASELELDRVHQRYQVALLDAVTVDAWNQDSGCGPFTLDVPRDVSGETCFGMVVPSFESPVYDRVEFDELGLRFGDLETGNRTTTEERPTDVAAPVYTRLR